MGGRRRPWPLAVAPLIERNRENARRQAHNGAIKPGGVGSPAVKEENRRRIVGSALQEMQANPVDRLHMVLCLVTSEQLTGHSLRLYGGCQSVKRATQNFFLARVRRFAIVGSNECSKHPPVPQ